MAPPSDRSRGESAAVSKALTIDDLRSFFHLPIVEVAKQLGTCTTALKKICRKNKIMKWPYRQIRSITKSIQSLEMASLNDTLPDDLKFQYREQVFELQKAIDEIVQDPNTDVSMHLKENFELEGDDFEDNDQDGDVSSATNSGRRFSGPSNSVMQIMQAAAATAGFETSSVKSSSTSANSKRKREEESLKALQEGSVVPDVQTPTIGLTAVGLIANADAYRNVYFVGPVHLAPLQRKKIKSTKKLVPLIEPDICNHYKMEFLPNSILHHSDKYANKELESALIAGAGGAGYTTSSAPMASAQNAGSGHDQPSAEATATLHGTAAGSASFGGNQQSQQQPQAQQLQQQVRQHHQQMQQDLQQQQQQSSDHHGYGQQQQQQQQQHSQSKGPDGQPVVGAPPYADYNAYSSALGDANSASSYNTFQSQGPSSYGGVKN